MPREEFTGRIKAVNRVLREDGKRCCRCTKFCVLLQYAIISLIVVVAAGFAIYGFVNLDTHDNSPAVFLGGALIISFTVSVVMIVKNIVKARKMERVCKLLLQAITYVL